MKNIVNTAFVFLIVTSLALALECAKTAEAEEGSGIKAFVDAYVLQEYCFRGADSSTLVGQKQASFCEGYVLGVVDTYYAVTGCPFAANYVTVTKALAKLLVKTPDDNLKRFTAASAVLLALYDTPEGKQCSERADTMASAYLSLHGYESPQTTR